MATGEGGQVVLHPPRLCTPALEAVTDADRLWFASHPRRRYRLRPTTFAEYLPGQAIPVGEHTVVAVGHRIEARLRFRVGRPPPGLRRDTDACCRELLRRLEETGIGINGMTIRRFVAWFRRPTVL